MKSGCTSALNQFFVQVASKVFVDVEFPGAQLGIKSGVFLVNDFVSGQVFAAHGQGFEQGLAPNFTGLAGNGEHEVQVQVVEAGVAKDIKRFEDHLPIVNTTETGQKGFVER